ncbi:MAG: hypothetical protein VX938_07270, partial [Myxococcota bacterium]|nr:hypothetical protein [Myxococcota bacterium]
ARALAAAGAQDVSGSNRSPDRARSLADRHGWHARDLTELEDLLTRTDVVVSSTGAARPIIDLETMERVVLARKYRPLFLVDIAIPRDVEPGVGRLDTVYLYNVDDLEEVSQENLAGREQEALHGESLVDEAVEDLATWSATESVKPTIKAIRDRISRVSSEELDRTLGKRLNHLGEEDRRSLEKMVEAMVSKILHPTMTELREGSVNGDIQSLVVAARRLYGLQEEEPSGGPPRVSPALKAEEEG